MRKIKIDNNELSFGWVIPCILVGLLTLWIALKIKQVLWG